MKKIISKLFINENLTIYFTGLIAFVTTIYTIFSFLQWRTMNDALVRSDTSNYYTRQSLELAKSTSDSNNISTQKALIIAENNLKISQENLRINEVSIRKSLAIAESSLIVSQKNLESNNLATVVTNTPYVSIMPSVGEIQETYFGYFIKFRNVGNTPAIMLMGKIFSEISDKKVRDNLDAHSEIFRIGNLLPKDSIFFHTDTVRIVTRDEYDKIFRKTHALKIHGFIEYSDIFGYIYRIEFSYQFDAEWDTWSIPNEGNEYKRIDKRSII